MARRVVRALYAEVALEPKPGLVSFRDNGSHHDMSAGTFVKSLFALRHYFAHMAVAGAADSPFHELQQLGIEAERRMLIATGGVNTHRGAIFSLGLLCASAGFLSTQGRPTSSRALRETLLDRWGQALRHRAQVGAQQMPLSNGQRAARHFGLRSAGEEAAQGFPTLFEVTLPSLQNAMAAGLPTRAAKVQAFFATMAVLDDTNVAHRGGQAAIDFVKNRAANFIAAGGVSQTNWLSQSRLIHEEFVSQRLSPGGAADMLACALWAQDMQRRQTSTPASSAQVAEASP